MDTITDTLNNLSSNLFGTDGVLGTVLGAFQSLVNSIVGLF